MDNEKKCSFYEKDNLKLQIGCLQIECTTIKSRAFARLVYDVR